jgi:putative ABC transport system substrate-binding protein
VNRRDLLTLLGGAALAWPLALRAQQKAMPVIGYLSGSSPGPSAPLVAAFHQGLADTGYVEGKNVAIEYHWAEGSYDRLPGLAAGLVGRKVDLIAASGGPPSAQAAKGATSTIPIVFVSGDDPVAIGLVASLARPGGNLTGVSFLTVELNPKRLELLFELVPEARVIALLVNPNNSITDGIITDVQKAAQTKGKKARSTPPSPRSSSCKPARSSSPATRSSTAGATGSWRWHPARRFRRSTSRANSPLRAG